MDDERVEAILDQMREHGGRVTQVRRLVIDTMVHSDDHHLTANDVIDGVRRVAPGFHESSVYRTLERLTDLGFVERVQIGAGAAVYHLAEHAHLHLVCEHCGAVIESDAGLLDAVAEEVHRSHGFDLRTDAATLHGTCRTCSAARRPPVGHRSG